ncbi:unnamed protein product [Ceutorhynchus assimilis]|uniref:Uncharacterized protein n=1 Tax=Ceutorhynchus assimilis TaxID=467358 RepID=A0A9N9MUP1_9CUCU|nr:unnamed protein product [Ceutorhynchus assimilis]
MPTAEVSIRNLQIITALDSLSYGMIYCFISPYLQKLGSSHVHVSILTIGLLIAEQLSPDVAKIFTHIHGKRYALFLMLNTAFITHIIMVLTDSYWFTILIRILFSITNQSQNLCLELLLDKAENDDMKQTLSRNWSILSGSGFIIGPIVSGYLFDIGFGYIGVLAAFLALINVYLLMSITKTDKDSNVEPADKSVLDKARTKVNKNIKEFKKCLAEKHWDILLLKYLFAASVMIFFSKFTQILKHNYYSGSITMGHIGSYINCLVFASTFLVGELKTTIQKCPLIFVSEISFLLIAILMILACYAPYLELYMLLLIPIIILRSFIMTLWKELFAERKSESLITLNSSASILAGLTVPLMFGLICNQIAYRAVILFSFVPMILCWVIIKWHSKFIIISNDEADKKDL